MATKYAHLPALVDESGVMVGYVDANHKERDLSGALVPPGTTPTPGGDVTVTSANITDSTDTGRAVLTAASAAAARTAIGAGTSSLVLGSTSTTALAGDATAVAAARLSVSRNFSVSGGAAGTSAGFNGTASCTIPIVLATPTESLRGGVLAQTVADIAAAPTMEDFNGLLAALRTAGVLTA